MVPSTPPQRGSPSVVIPLLAAFDALVECGHGLVSRPSLQLVIVGHVVRAVRAAGSNTFCCFPSRCATHNILDLFCLLFEVDCQLINKSKHKTQTTVRNKWQHFTVYGAPCGRGVVVTQLPRCIGWESNPTSISPIKYRCSAAGSFERNIVSAS